MITIKANTQKVIGDMALQLGLLLDTRKMMTAVAASVLPVLKNRVHRDGKDSSGNEIGRYSKSYMAVRTGIYGNSGKYVKGKKTGQTKDTGTFTRGAHKGSPRPKYNRTTDTKVIGSLTRNMENHMVVIPTDNGAGIGYTDDYNLKKAIWLDQTYKKKILTQLTTAELELATETADKFVTDIANQL